MKLPHKLDAEDFFSQYETLQDWADDNPELFSSLVLEGCEALAYTEATDITVLTIGVPGVMGVTVELDMSSAEETVRINEEHWVKVEDYSRAARARDAREYIKKKAQHANTRN